MLVLSSERRCTFIVTALVLVLCFVGVCPQSDDFSTDQSPFTDEEDWPSSGDGEVANSSSDGTVISSAQKVVRVDVGSPVTIPCNVTFRDHNVVWVKDGKAPNLARDSEILNNGSLYFEKIKDEDSGVYTCMYDTSGTHSLFSFRLVVRTRPPPLQNVTVEPRTVLARVRWDVLGDGGYPLSGFHLQYRSNSSESSQWISPVPLRHLSPAQRRVEVFRLEPNTTYQLEVWASNQLGPGTPTIVLFRTKHDSSELEMARLIAKELSSGDRASCILAVAITLGSVALVLGLGLLLVWRRHRWSISILHRGPDKIVGNDSEIIELIPNIIVNPGFYPTEIWDENSNKPAPAPENNNTVIHPHRV